MLKFFLVTLKEEKILKKLIGRKLKNMSKNENTNLIGKIDRI